MSGETERGAMGGAARGAASGLKQALSLLAWPAALVTVALLAAMLTARRAEERAGEPGVLSGREIRLRDGAGRVRIRMRAEDAGPVIELFRAGGGEPSATLAAGEEGPFLLLEGGGKLAIAALETGARLDLYAPGGGASPRVSLGATADVCDVTLRDASGRPVALFAHAPSGSGLRLNGEGQREAVTLGGGKEGGWIATYGPDGKARWSSLAAPVEGRRVGE